MLEDSNTTNPFFHGFAIVKASNAEKDNFNLLFRSRTFDEREFVSHTAVRSAIYQKSKGKCYYCGRTFEDTWHKGYSVDHILPWKTYHNNHPTNLTPCCGECNRSKWARDMEEWRPIFSDKHGSDIFYYERCYVRLKLITGSIEERGKPICWLCVPHAISESNNMGDDDIVCGLYNDFWDFIAAFENSKTTRNFVTGGCKPIQVLFDFSESTKEHSVENFAKAFQSVYLSSKEKIKQATGRYPELYFNTHN